MNNISVSIDPEKLQESCNGLNTDLLGLYINALLYWQDNSIIRTKIDSIVEDIDENVIEMLDTIVSRWKQVNE